MDFPFFNPFLQAGAILLLGVLTMAIIEAMELQAKQRSWKVMFWTAMAFAVINPLLGFFDLWWMWVPLSLVCGVGLWFVLLFVTPRIGREQDDIVGAHQNDSDPEHRVSFLPVLVWAGLSGLLVLTQVIVAVVQHFSKK